jgi:PAS domain S-box-containing protein
LNRQPTLWEAYKWYIVGGACLFLVQTSLIVGLLWQRAIRRKAEATVRESEERFRLVANTAPVMIWTSGSDKLRNYFNKPWLSFTGHTLDQELGDDWAEGVHDEDLAKCLKTYAEAFDKREQFETEYRLRRHDGEYHHWPQTD